MRTTALKRWAIAVLLWGIMAATQTTFIFNMRRTFGTPIHWLTVARMPFTVYFVIWGMLVTPFVAWACRRFPLERANWRRRALLHMAFSVSLSVALASVRLPLHHFIYPKSTETVGWMLFRGYFFSNGFDDITLYWAVAFVCHTWLYYRRFRDREVQAAQLEAQLARTHLHVLKMQLHPHFLFNTLHSVSELMHQDVEAADRMIARLSDLLRLTLEHTGAHEVPLKLELDFVESYVEIEQTRFRDRLQVDYQIAPNTLDAQVPNLLLQPLIENSIRHGIARHSGPGHILFVSELRDGQLHILLRDDGPSPADGRKRSVSSFGVGLQNTRGRLRQMYGDAHTFSIHQPAEGGFEVSISFPFATTPRFPSAAGLQPLTISSHARPISEVGAGR